MLQADAAAMRGDAAETGQRLGRDALHHQGGALRQTRQTAAAPVVDAGHQEALAIGEPDEIGAQFRGLRQGLLDPGEGGHPPGEGPEPRQLLQTFKLQLGACRIEADCDGGLQLGGERPEHLVAGTDQHGAATPVADPADQQSAAEHQGQHQPHERDLEGQAQGRADAGVRGHVPVGS